MATADEIPADLLDLQRQFNVAQAAVVTASAKDEPIDDLMATARDLAVRLHRRRAGTPWEAWDAQKRVREAAASSAEGCDGDSA